MLKITSVATFVDVLLKLCFTYVLLLVNKRSRLCTYYRKVIVNGAIKKNNNMQTCKYKHNSKTCKQTIEKRYSILQQYERAWLVLWNCYWSTLTINCEHSNKDSPYSNAFQYTSLWGIFKNGLGQDQPVL